MRPYEFSSNNENYTLRIPIPTLLLKSFWCNNCNRYTIQRLLCLIVYRPIFSVGLYLLLRESNHRRLFTELCSLPELIKKKLFRNLKKKFCIYLTLTKSMLLVKLITVEDNPSHNEELTEIIQLLLRYETVAVTCGSKFLHLVSWFPLFMW